MIAELNFEIRRLKLPYFIPKESVIKSARDQSGYEPDVIVIDEGRVIDNPRWEKNRLLLKEVLYHWWLKLFQLIGVMIML